MHRSSSSCRTFTRNASSETGRPKANRNPLCRLRDKSIEACLTDDIAIIKSTPDRQAVARATMYALTAAASTRSTSKRCGRCSSRAYAAGRSGSRPSASRIAADEVEDEAFEVRSLGYVHRRARRRNGLARGTDAIASRFEELVEYVVLVGGEDQAADRQAHRFRDVAGENVAEVAARHGEVHLLAVAPRHREVTLEVVHDLSRNAR